MVSTTLALCVSATAPIPHFLDQPVLSSKGGLFVVYVHDLSHLPQAHSLFLFHLNLPDMSHESQLVWPSRHQPQLVFAYVSLRISCYHPYLEPTYSLSPFQAMFPFS